jgi:hypothetical protein
MVGVATAVTGVMGAISWPAAALVFVEPNFGLGAGSAGGSFDSTVATPALNTSSSVTAPSGGVRLGVFSDYVFVGADIKLSFLSASGQSNAMYTAGFGIGFTAEYIPMRMYFSIDAFNQIASLSSFGFRGGIGYYFSEDFVFNIEYQTVTFSNTVAGASSNTPYHAVAAMLSFPMTFQYPNTPWRERYRSGDTEFFRQGPSPKSDGVTSDEAGGVAPGEFDDATATTKGDDMGDSENLDFSNDSGGGDSGGDFDGGGSGGGEPDDMGDVKLE